MPSYSCYLQWLGRLSWTGCLLLSSCWANIHAAEEPAPPASAEQIQTWADQLDSAIFAEREDATIALVKQGAAAIGPVAQQLSSPSLEATSRALHILQELAQADNLDTQAAARDAIVAAAQEAGPMSRRFAVAIAALNQKRSAKALLDLERLGARIERRTELFVAGVPNFAIQGLPNPANFGIALQLGSDFKGTIGDLRRLEWLENVSQLELSGEKVTDAMVAMAVKVPGLVSLHLYDTVQVTDQGLAILPEAKSLRELGLYYMPATDAAVPSISKIISLNELKLYGTQITAEKKVELVASLMAARIDYRRGAFLGVGGLSSENELVVNIVHEGSPAEKAGLQPGDVLLTFEGKPLDQFDTLTKLISEHKPADKVKIDVRRSGQVDPIAIEVTLGRWEQRLSVSNQRR